MLPVVQRVTIGVTQVGSEALPSVPNNHSKRGEGTSEGRGIGSIRVAEHDSEKAVPATPGPEASKVTVLNCTDSEGSDIMNGVITL